MSYADKKILDGKINIWQKKIDDHKAGQLINPFSFWEGASHRPKLDKSDPDYGKPLEGSPTYQRGLRAHEHVCKEITEMCHEIADLGDQQEDGTYETSFGRLFQRYQYISDKCVGILCRCRKYGYVEFDGEMLYQGQDENKIIKLKKLPVWEELIQANPLTKNNSSSSLKQAS